MIVLNGSTTIMACDQMITYFLMPTRLREHPSIGNFTVFDLKKRDHTDSPKHILIMNTEHGLKKRNDHLVDVLVK